MVPRSFYSVKCDNQIGDNQIGWYRQAEEASTDNPRDLSRTTDRTCTHAKEDVWLHEVHTQTHTHTQAHRHTQTRTHARTHAHARTRTHARARAHTHTHAQAQARDRIVCLRLAAVKSLIHVEHQPLAVAKGGALTR